MGVLNKIFSGGANKLVESVGGILDNVITTKDEKLEAKRKLKELILSHEVEMEKNITSRWESDMKSDSFLSKNIRPMVLIYLTFIFTVLAFFHGNIGGFEVDSQYVPIFQSLLITVYSAYFVGRTWEKTRNK